MTKKKRSSEILADENGKFFREKGKFQKFSRKSKKIRKYGGNLKQGGKCIMASVGMDASIRTPGLTSMDVSLESFLKAFRPGLNRFQAWLNELRRLNFSSTRQPALTDHPSVWAFLDPWIFLV